MKKGYLKKIWNDVHLEKGGKGRPRNSWMQEIATGMGDEGINNMEWNDSEECRRKIKF